MYVRFVDETGGSGAARPRHVLRHQDSASDRPSTRASKVSWTERLVPQNCFLATPSHRV